MTRSTLNPGWFVAETLRAMPRGVRSIVLFGSAAAGDFVEGVSGYDLLVILEELGQRELQSIGPVVRHWRAAGQPLPLLFSWEQLQASADVFAMEMLDMQRSRRVLHGTDLIAELVIDPAHVRLHLEREWRGKALALRDQYVLAAGDTTAVCQLLCDSLSTFLSLMRAALRLYSQDVPAIKLAAAVALGQLLGFDAQPFIRVDEIREGHLIPQRVNGEQLFCDYWQAIEHVCRVIDRKLGDAGVCPPLNL